MGTVVSLGSAGGQSRAGQARDGGVWAPEWPQDGGAWQERGFQDQGEPRTSVELTDSEFLAALDSVFTFASSTKQFVVNAMSTLGGISFMVFMSYMPDYSTSG